MEADCAGEMKTPREKLALKLIAKTNNRNERRYTFDQQSVTNKGAKARRLGGNPVCMYALSAVHLVALVVCLFVVVFFFKESLIINLFYFFSFLLGLRHSLCSLVLK